MEDVKATLLYRHREEFDDGAIVDVIVWHLPEPVQGSNHPYKYRLFYGYPGKRMVGYDNERGKSDHRHYDDREEPYQFSTPRQLIEDFLADVQRMRKAG